MALSYNDYTSDGAETVYQFTFPYISAAHVEVYIDLGEGAGFEETLDFELTDVDEITLDTAAPENAIVRVARNSAREEATPLTEYATGRLRAEDLNVDARQAFYLAQEAYEQGGSTNTTQIQVQSDEIDAIDDRVTTLEGVLGIVSPFFEYTVSTDAPAPEDGNNGAFWFEREA